MLRPALRVALPRAIPRTRHVRAYTPTLTLRSTGSTGGRRPIPIPLETPLPDCSSSAPFSPSPPRSPLETVPPPGSEPLPPPDVPRSVAARRSLLLFSIPVPPSAWPSHLEFASPLLSETGNVLKRTGVAVNAAWDGVGQSAFPSPRSETPPNTNSDADASFTESQAEGPESYPARLIYPDGKVFHFPAFSEQTLDSIELRKALMYRPVVTEELKAVSEVLVCTHGSRDCRCADHGGPLVAALREQGVTVHEIAHVGGHKWAANALLLPSLDMLSNLRSTDARALADFTRTPTKTSPLWAHWRGRFGVGEQAQHRQWEGIRAAFERAPSGPKVAGTTVPLTFRTFEGEIKAVDARVGDSLLLVAHEFDLPAMEGTCGGNAECATCHCYLAPRPRAPPVPEPSEDELDMLDFALDYRDGMSRLGCQIQATPELAQWCAEGGVIDLPRF